MGENSRKIPKNGGNEPDVASVESAMCRRRRRHRRHRRRRRRRRRALDGARRGADQTGPVEIVTVVEVAAQLRLGRVAQHGGRPRPRQNHRVLVARILVGADQSQQFLLETPEKPRPTTKIESNRTLNSNAPPWPRFKLASSLSFVLFL